MTLTSTNINSAAYRLEGQPSALNLLIGALQGFRSAVARGDMERAKELAVEIKRLRKVVGE